MHLGCFQQVILGLLGKLYVKYLFYGVTQEKGYTLPFLDICDYSQTELDRIESEKKISKPRPPKQTRHAGWRSPGPPGSLRYMDDQRPWPTDSKLDLFPLGAPFLLLPGRSLFPTGWLSFLPLLQWAVITPSKYIHFFSFPGLGVGEGIG